MNLSDYPTPITDAHEMEDNGETGPVYELARDLERKLAKCRNVMTGLMLGMELLGNRRTTDKIKQTLEETEP